MYGEPFASEDQADTGDRDYYSTDGITCTEALLACLGREGYICWLRGTIIKYSWRLSKKPSAKPEEDAVKMRWYSNELARILAEPEQVK